MTALVNGVPRSVAVGTTVAELVAELGHDPKGRGIAVALNGAVAPRATWPAIVMADGDRVEVLAAIGGG